MNNLVIGTAVGYDWNFVMFFVSSFRLHNKTDDLVLLMDNVDSQTAGWLHTFNVKAVRFNPATYRGSIANTRFIEYLIYLSKNKYSNVLLCDVRDIIFQSNVFENVQQESYLFFFKEDAAFKIKDNTPTKQWITDFYGEEITAAIDNNSIICSGTIMGDYNSILEFLYLFVEEFNTLSEEKQKLFADQGILNKMAYTGAFKDLPVVLKDNGDIVATLCLTLEKTLEKSGSDKLYIDFREDRIKLNQYTPSVIHQFDRSKTLLIFCHHLTFEIAPKA